ncbi:hypothetical protein FOZ62_004513, partial [Perkinsus olseni]
LMGELVETRRQRKPEPAPDEFIVTAPYADAILSIFERMERCEGERDEALALVRSWKDRRAEFERNFELTKNKLKAVKEIINNNSSEMSLKVEHLAQMAKQNQ